VFLSVIDTFGECEGISLWSHQNNIVRVGKQMDGAVRNSLGDILQFIYGEDGMDGGYIEQQIDSYYMSDRVFYEKFRIDGYRRRGRKCGLPRGCACMANGTQRTISI